MLDQRASITAGLRLTLSVPVPTCALCGRSSTTWGLRTHTQHRQCHAQPAESLVSRSRLDHSPSHGSASHLPLAFGRWTSRFKSWQMTCAFRRAQGSRPSASEPSRLYVNRCGDAAVVDSRSVATRCSRQTTLACAQFPVVVMLVLSQPSRPLDGGSSY